VEPHAFVVEVELHGDVDVVVGRHAYEEDHEPHDDDDDLDDVVHRRRVHYGGALVEDGDDEVHHVESWSSMKVHDVELLEEVHGVKSHHHHSLM
jgi:hypothetical protein